MKSNLLDQKTPRRGFLGLLASGAAALGFSALSSPTAAASAATTKLLSTDQPHEADQWFTKLKGKHRVVYDAPHPNEIMPFAWPKVFLMTNEMTGTPAADCGVVVVWRHSAICYAFKDEMWAKYNFAELFNVKEHGGAFQAADAAVATKTRNPFWNTNPGDFKIPSIGAVDIGIRDLQSSGVMICVCSTAMGVYSTIIAGKMSLKPEDVLSDWKAHMIPGIQPVPSGVWALGRAQEHKCGYIFAG